MQQSLRSQVLQAYKSLHKTRKNIFEGDVRALEAGRLKINEEFKKNKHVSDPTSISELVKFANAVEVELRTNVIQAVERKPGTYEARITPETIKFDNIPYKDCERTNDR